VKQRPRHRCSRTWLIIGIIVWEGIQRSKADKAYDVLKDKLPKYGMAMEVSKREYLVFNDKPYSKQVSRLNNTRLVNLIHKAHLRF
jgi:hypothetical protein